MFKIIQSKKSNFNLQYSFGNNIMYGFKKISSIKEFDSNIEVLSGNSYGKFLVTWFSPIIVGGGELKLSKYIVLDTNVSISTEKPLLTNYNLGLNIGVKLRL